MFVNIMCKAGCKGSCMLNRPSLCRAHQLPWLELRHLAVRLFHPHSLLAFLSRFLTSNSSLRTIPCIYRNMEALFVFHSDLPSAETDKCFYNPAANYWVTEPQRLVAAVAADDVA